MSDELHPFERSGLGRAPFKCVGMAEVPSPSLAAANPAAYNAALRMLPRGYGCGSCAYCGMGLRYNYLIHSADGQTFAVGSECVFKTDDKRLGAEAKRIENAKRREESAAKRAARDEARRQTFLKRKAEREAAEAVAAAARAEAERPAREARKAAWSFLLPVLRAEYQGAFVRDMIVAIERGDPLGTKPANILADIYAKAHGRRGSKAYNAALAEFSERTSE